MEQSSLSLRTWTYLGTVFGLALILSILLVPEQPIAQTDWSIFAILVILAIATQFMEARFGRQTYTPHLVPFFAGLLLLPPTLVVLLIAIPHLVEWAHKRLTDSYYLGSWYIQPFNIATHIIAALSVQQFLVLLRASESIESVSSSFWATVAGILLYLTINHCLIGQVLLLARGISWSDSRMWSVEIVAPGIAMLSVGYVVAILWHYSPWLIIPALAPLGIMFQSMKVPQLQQEARTDEKTGLVNSRHFKERFHEELVLARRFNRPLAVLMADLDLLRDINNTYGHLAGDVVIAGIAEIIRNETRDYDIAARFGGEEYAIVLPNTTNAVASSVAERLRSVVEDSVFHVPSTGVEMHATISIGVALMPDNADGMDDLIHEADVALYQAKYQGRNRVVNAADVPHSFKLEYKSREDDTDNQGQSDTHIDTPGQTADKTHPNPENQRSVPVSTPQQRSHAASRDVKQSAVADTPQAEPASHPLFRSYLSVVIAGGLLTTAWGLWTMDLTILGTLAAFAVLAVLAESVNITMYTRSSVSASATVTLAAILLAGLPGAIATSSAIAVVHYNRQHPPLYRAFFNWSLHILAAVIPAVILGLSPYTLTANYAHIWGLLCVAAAVPYFLVETSLIAGAISLKERENVISVWKEHFRWLGVHYVVMSILSVFVGLAYAGLGLWGLIGFALPIYLIQHSQKMYVQGTESSVAELHRMNGELQTANAEVQRASWKIHDLNMELLELLAKIIDARDPDTSGHALNVGSYAMAIGSQFNLSPEQLEDLRWAGMLHDIGKLGVSEKILFKPAALTNEEYEQVKKHAELGGALLETVQGLSHLAPFVRHHHERWDGTGYPAGLAGEEIPLEARILAVCDAAEAMAAARPYKQEYSMEEIVAELRRCSGGQFDPTIIEAFIRELPASVTQEAQHSSKEVSTANREREAKNGFAIPELPPLIGNPAILPGSLQPST